MELCTRTTTTITHLPSLTNGHLSRNPFLHTRISLPLHRNIASLSLQSRCSRKFPGETVSEEGVNDFGVEKSDGLIEERNLNGEIQAESFKEDEQTQALEFSNDFKLESDNTYSYLLYGSGAIVALYVTSAVVGSLESIPLLPKLMEVVGLGYTVWFTTRYLLFKKNREELKTKISEIKKQVLGSDSE